MKYYKLLHGFGSEDYIEINEDELEKAFLAFFQKKDAVFSGGAIRGGMVQAIKPDFHRTMGWNRGYKLEALDYEELQQKGIDRKMQNLIEDVKNKVTYLIETKQEHLIGKGFEMPKIENQFSVEVKSLADKFKV